MKKILSALLVFLLMFTLCTANQQEARADYPVSGQYNLFIVETMGAQSDPAEMGMSGSLLLRDDGTGAMISNGAEEILPSWSEENGTVTMVDSTGEKLEVELKDGVIVMEAGAGYYLYFAREGIDTANYQIIDHTPDSILYGIYKNIDAKNGAHLDYEYHSDYMDSTSVFDVHAENGIYFSLRTTRTKDYEQLNANCFKDGTSYVLYPNEMRGNVATRISSSIITNNVLMLDDLYGLIYQRAWRRDFATETKELDGMKYTVEVYPAQNYVAEVTFYYNSDGKLEHVLVGPLQTAPELGETFYTVHAIDDVVNETLFDISGYTITE